MIRTLVAFLIFGAFILGAAAQEPSDYLSPFGTYDSTNVTHTNLLTGAVTVHIPLASLSQKGDFAYSVFADGSANTTFYTQDRTNELGEDSTRYLIGTPSYIYVQATAPPGAGATTVFYNGYPSFTYITLVENGAEHKLFSAGTGTDWQAIDGSGFRLSSDYKRITDSKGIVTTPVKDSSGNYYSVSTDRHGNRAGLISNGYSAFLTDSMNRRYGYADSSSTDTSGCSGARPTLYASSVTISDASGAGTGNPLLTFKQCMASVHIKTDFNTYSNGSGGPRDAEVDATVDIVQSIVLPDQTTWDL